jgi:hypothetical protein
MSTHWIISLKASFTAEWLVLPLKEAPHILGLPSSRPPSGHETSSQQARGGSWSVCAPGVLLVHLALLVRRPVWASLCSSLYGFLLLRQEDSRGILENIISKCNGTKKGDLW